MNTAMAIAKLVPLFTEVHGKIGDLIFRRGPNGQTIILKMSRWSLWKVNENRGLTEELQVLRGGIV